MDSVIALLTFLRYFFGCCGKWVPTIENIRDYKVYMNTKQTLLSRFLPENPIVPDLEVMGYSALLVFSWLVTILALFVVMNGIKKSKQLEKSKKYFPKDTEKKPSAKNEDSPKKKAQEADNPQIKQRKQEVREK